MERERRNLAFFETLPDNKPAGLDATLVRGVQYLTPLFDIRVPAPDAGKRRISGS